MTRRIEIRCSVGIGRRTLWPMIRLHIGQKPSSQFSGAHGRSDSTKKLGRFLPRLHFRPSSPLRRCNLLPRSCRERPLADRNNLVGFSRVRSNLCPSRSLGSRDPSSPPRMHTCLALPLSWAKIRRIANLLPALIRCRNSPLACSRDTCSLRLARTALGSQKESELFAVPAERPK